tara:strand:+ start:1788 stop:2645 length:858 start_codon:yes stop_codon:yes gene_type:complete
MPKSWTLIDIIKWGEQFFEDRGFDNPRAEIEWLLCSLLENTRLDIYLKYDMPISNEKLRILRSWIKRREKKEPLQYITGVCEFYGREFFVNSDVLIPRPETERIIDIALEHYKKINQKPSILDIGSGSGCISITMALEISESNVLGLDSSSSANKIARKNSLKLKAKNVSFDDMDILTNTPAKGFDIVISNPPYIPQKELNTIMPDVINFEPHIALTDSLDGLTFYRRYAKLCEHLLTNNGIFLLEVGLGDHCIKVEKIFRREGYNNINCYKDFNGDERILLIQL